MDIQKLLEKNLLVELGIEEAAPEIQEKVVSQFTETLLKKIMARIFDLLPEGKKDEFLKLQEAGDEEKLENFLKNNIPNFENLMTETIEAAKEEYQNIVEELTS